jgi:hypothetical protein
MKRATIHPVNRGPQRKRDDQTSTRALADAPRPAARRAMRPLSFRVLRRLGASAYSSGTVLARELSVSRSTIWSAVRDIEVSLRNRLKQEVSSSAIGELALRRLKDVDTVAYVRFASVYRHFEDTDEFADELRRLEMEPPLPRGQRPLDEHMFELLTEPAPAERPPRRRLRALAGGLGVEEDTSTAHTKPEEANDGD